MPLYEIIAPLRTAPPAELDNRSRGYEAKLPFST
jgi:hypothetical protein